MKKRAVKKGGTKSELWQEVLFMDSGERDGNGVGGNMRGEAFHAEGTAVQKPCSQEEVRVA